LVEQAEAFSRRRTIKRVLFTQAGGRIGLGFARSLRAAPEPTHLIGVDSNEFHLHRAVADERYLVPRAAHPTYLAILQSIVEETRPDLVWVQHEDEILAVARDPGRIRARTFLPDARTIAACQDKMTSSKTWERSGVPTPRSMMMNGPEDVALAFGEIGPHLWLRAVKGVAGSGSLPADDVEKAATWIDLHKGWGRFMAAERMTGESVSCEYVWKRGRLLAAQCKKRLFWEFPNLTLSGISGVCGAHEFVSNPTAVDLGVQAIQTVDPEPNGAFGVDMIYDGEGCLKVTEVNAGRFFSGGSLHLQVPGFNLPYLALRAALDEPLPRDLPHVDSLPAGIVVIQGVSVEPIVTTTSAVREYRREMEARMSRAGNTTSNLANSGRRN